MPNFGLPSPSLSLVRLGPGAVDQLLPWLLILSTEVIEASAWDTQLRAEMVGSLHFCGKAALVVSHKVPDPVDDLRREVLSASEALVSWATTAVHRLQRRKIIIKLGPMFF